MPWINAGVFLIVLLLLAWPLGDYMARVFQGERTWLTRAVLPLEQLTYRICGIDASEEMTWSGYAFAAIAVSAVSAAFLYALLRTQAWLPLNPQHFPNLSPDVAWNTAVSFMTTTDWEAYIPEQTMSYLSQMAGLSWMNFVAGAIGLAVSIAVIRGFMRSSTSNLGNFWVDFTRSLYYVIVPLCVVFALLFVFQGIPQNFSPYVTATNAEHFSQSITGGAMASQEAPKLIGGNGGGIVAANSASPNENPTGFTNFLELIAIWLIPAALPLTFGRMIGNRAAGYTLLATIAVTGFVIFAGAQISEQVGNPLVHALGVQGGNFEGKETRFGVTNAGLSLAVASNSGTGSSNFAYDSLMPLAGLAAMVSLQLGEVIFGGVGSGLYGLIVFAVLTVFIAGLMVGRTPEYLGKRIERREVQFSMLAVLAFPLMILIPAAIAAMVPAGLATLGNTGTHGFSEILYAYSSTASNNGSAFAGLGPNLFYNLTTGVSMVGGRFLVMIPTLALAGVLAARPLNRSTTVGTFRTDNALFVVLLIGVMIFVGALTFFPGDSLGPIAEHFSLFRSGR